MEVIDSYEEAHISWFKLKENSSLAMEVAFEEFYHDHFLEYEVFIGYTEFATGEKPNYILGTTELEIVNRLQKKLGAITELMTHCSIICIQ